MKRVSRRESEEIPRVFLSRPQPSMHCSVSTMFCNWSASISDVRHVNASSPLRFTVFSSTHRFPDHDTANAHLLFSKASHFIMLLLLLLLLPSDVWKGRAMRRARIGRWVKLNFEETMLGKLENSINGVLMGAECLGDSRTMGGFYR